GATPSRSATPCFAAVARWPWRPRTRCTTAGQCGPHPRGVSTRWWRRCSAHRAPTPARAGSGSPATGGITRPGPCRGVGPRRGALSALREAGARLAGPGEFTLRAFLNGRLDLTQAEAVADLIQAATERAHDLALSQLAGVLRQRLDRIADRLADATAEVEARV